MDTATASPGLYIGRHSQSISPSQHAVNAVRARPPIKRRKKEPETSADNKAVPLRQSDVQRIMGEYHALRQTCLNMHEHKTPELLARNQELLAEKVKVIQQARFKQTQANPAGTPAQPIAGHQPANPAGQDAAQASNGDQQAAAKQAAAGHAAAAQQNEPLLLTMQVVSGEAVGQSTENPARALSNNPEGTEHVEPSRTSSSAAGADSKQPLEPYIAEYYARHGTGDWQQISELQAVRLPYASRIPEYFSWSMMVRNQLAPELPPGTRLFYPDNEGESIPISDDEVGSKPWFCEYGFTHDYALMKLAEIYNDKLDWLFEALEKGLEKGKNGYEVSSSDLKARLRYLLKEEGKHLIPEDSRRRQSAFRKSCKVFHQQFCNRCKIYGCPQHGGGHVLPASEDNPPAPVVADVGSLPCGDKCWRHGPAALLGIPATTTTSVADGSAVPAAAGMHGCSETQQQADDVIQQKGPKLTSLQEGLLAEGLAAFGPDPCSLALMLLDYSCSDLYQLLLQRGINVEQHQQQVQQQEGTEGASEAAAAAAKKRKRRGQCGKTTTIRKYIEHRRWLNGERCWATYEPCNCVGPCQKGSCSCIDNGNYCEKFCACASCKGKRDCTFQGCECKTACKFDSCPCRKMLKECDPLLCKNCTATATGSAADHECCRNMNLRLNKNKRVQIGLSGVAGWGAFLLEPAAQGEFIGEYIGELLPQEEADRRGSAYDKSDNSYLFTINRDWVLDARQRGNKLRFANHSSRPNCMTKVLMVDGDYRVGLFAGKDLKPGDELFYNYMYDLDNAPDWALAAGAQTMPTA